MSWLILILSGVLEAVWATALGRSDGLTRLVPSVVFGVALVASMAGLALAMRTLPTGTSYAVWVGIGAALTRDVVDGDGGGAGIGGTGAAGGRDRRLCDRPEGRELTDLRTPCGNLRSGRPRLEPGRAHWWT